MELFAAEAEAEEEEEAGGMMAPICLPTAEIFVASASLALGRLDRNHCANCSVRHITSKHNAQHNGATAHEPNNQKMFKAQRSCTVTVLGAGAALTPATGAFTAAAAAVSAEGGGRR